jgi:hypothetical protein
MVEELSAVFDVTSPDLRHASTTDQVLALILFQEESNVVLKLLLCFTWNNSVHAALRTAAT